MSVTKLLAGGLMAVGLMAASANDAAAQYGGRGGQGYSRGYAPAFGGGGFTRSYSQGFYNAPQYGYGSGYGYGVPAYSYRPAFVSPGFVSPGYGGGFYNPGSGFSRGGFGYPSRSGFSFGFSLGGW